MMLRVGCWCAESCECQSERHRCEGWLWLALHFSTDELVGCLSSLILCPSFGVNTGKPCLWALSSLFHGGSVEGALHCWVKKKTIFSSDPREYPYCSVGVQIASFVRSDTFFKRSNMSFRETRFEVSIFQGFHSNFLQFSGKEAKKNVLNPMGYAFHPWHKTYSLLIRGVTTHHLQSLRGEDQKHRQIPGFGQYCPSFRVWSFSSFIRGREHSRAKTKYGWIVTQISSRFHWELRCMRRRYLIWLHPSSTSRAHHSMDSINKMFCDADQGMKKMQPVCTFLD